MISIQNLNLHFGQKSIFNNANLTLVARQKVGIIGINGSGKSTLFSLILKELEPDSGQCSIIPNITIAHAEQSISDIETTAIDYVLQGDKRCYEIHLKIQEALANEDYEKLAPLYSDYEDAGGYSSNAKAAQLLNGLGFLNSDLDKKVKEFSGGWRVRLTLAKTLMSPSDLLLLDEPTNHLDLDTILWLEEWLIQYTGTLIIISHDRDFLDEIVGNIVHLEHQQFKMYTGNYSSFEKQRAQMLMLQQSMYEKQQKHFNHVMKFVNKFKAKASKARQAQSRLKALDKIEFISAVQSESDFSFDFFEAKNCSNPVIAGNDISVSYGDYEVLSKININIETNARIGLLGPNGAGKSTFVKVLAKALEPSIGQVIYNKNLKIGYFAQHQLEQLNLNESPLWHLQNISKETPDKELRTYLGSFNFSNEKALSPIKKFSGGEKARLALAILVWQKPNLLLLDEPTNHLDLNMREALALALQSYNGSLIVVSHDRHLLRMTVDRFLLVANKSVTEFEGDLDDYHSWLTDHRKELKQSENLNKDEQNKTKLSNNEKKRLKSELNNLESKIKKKQEKLKLIDEKLSSSNLYQDSDKDLLINLLKDQKELIATISSLEEEWLKINENLE